MYDSQYKNGRSLSIEFDYNVEVECFISLIKQVNTLGQIKISNYLFT